MMLLAFTMPCRVERVVPNSLQSFKFKSRIIFGKTLQVGVAFID